MPIQSSIKLAFKGTISFHTLILIIFPAVYFAIALISILNFGPFYQQSTDPEYFHLLNGINIALFNLATPYTDHPGTPLQIIVALSSWPISLGFPGSLVNNVIDHPETFLKGAILLKNIIISAVLFFAGRSILRATKNIWIALLLQLIPFGSAFAMTVIGRLNPEGFMVVPIVLLIVVMVQYLYGKPHIGLTTKQVNFLSVIGGLGMAIKFSYFPFLFIPIFLMKPFKQLIRYGILSILFTLLFALPILFNLSNTLTWFGGMLLHSGSWGAGESNFINWGEVPLRLSQLLSFNYLFTGLLMILTGLLIYSWLFLQSKRSELKVLNLISAGVIFGIAFSTFLITKHFAFRYYIPNLLFQIILIYLIFEYMVRIFRFRKLKTYSAILIFGFGLILAITQTKALNTHNEATLIKHQADVSWSDEVKAQMTEDLPLIISSFYAGCPFPEFALNNSYLLCGNLKSTFSEKLRDKYPGSVMYVGWSEQFYHWNYFWDASDFVDPEKGVYVFIGRDKKKDQEVIFARLKKAYSEYSIQPELLLQKATPDEFFYKISFVKGDE